MVEMLKGFFEACGVAITVFGPYGYQLSVCCLCLLYVGYVKTNVFTKTAHYKKRPVWFYWHGRRTLALQPFVIGAFFGCFMAKDPGWLAVFKSAMQLGSAGAMSVWLFEVGRGLAKKQGYELPDLGVDDE